MGHKSRCLVFLFLGIFDFFQFFLFSFFFLRFLIVLILCKDRRIFNRHLVLLRLNILRIHFVFLIFISYWFLDSRSHWEYFRWKFIVLLIDLTLSTYVLLLKWIFLIRLHDCWIWRLWRSCKTKQINILSLSIIWLFLIFTLWNI